MNDDNSLEPEGRPADSSSAPSSSSDLVVVGGGRGGGGRGASFALGLPGHDEEIRVVAVRELPAGPAAAAGRGVGRRGALGAQQRGGEAFGDQALAGPGRALEQQRVGDIPGAQRARQQRRRLGLADDVAEDHGSPVSRAGKMSPSRSAIRASTSRGLSSAATIRNRNGSAPASVR